MSMLPEFSSAGVFLAWLMIRYGDGVVLVGAGGWMDSVDSGCTPQSLIHFPSPFSYKYNRLTANLQINDGSGYQGAKALPHYRTFSPNCLERL